MNSLDAFNDSSVQLKNIPTIILSELPISEKEKYFKFLLENDVQFTEDHQGFYTAIIKVVNSSDNLPFLRSEKSRILESTFSSKQKTVITESPRSASPNLSIKSKSPTSKRVKSPNNYSPSRFRGITDILEENPTKSNPTLNTSRSSSRTPEKTRAEPLKLYLQSTKFQDFFSQLKLGTLGQLRPKTLSISIVLKNIEEIYSSRYKREIEDKQKKNEEIFNNFSVFVAEFFIEKYKNKRMTDQNALDFCHSVETYDSECLEVKIFSSLLTNVYSGDVLVFFLYARHTCVNILDLKLVAKFSSQKIQDPRTVTLNLKQCRNVAAAVYREEESLQKAFLAQLEGELKGSSIKLYEFLSVFIENFKYSLQENSIISPYTSVNNTENFGDSLINTENEASKSFNSSAFISSQKIINQPESRPLPKGPFDRIKNMCVDHCSNVLVHQFVKIILSGHLDPRSPNKKDIVLEVENFVSEKMIGLIEAVCKCDKRKWMEVLETDVKDSLKHCENLQKKLREVQKKNPEPLPEDIDNICKEILQNPELKALIGEKLRIIVGS